MSSEISDKRREVARRLREYPVHLAAGGKGDLGTARDPWSSRRSGSGSAR